MHTVCSHICKQNTHKFKSDKMVCIMNIDIFSVNLCALKYLRPILLSLVYVEYFFLFFSLMICIYHILSRPKIHSPLWSNVPSFTFRKEQNLQISNNYHGIRWNKTRHKSYIKAEWGHIVGGKGTQNKKNSERISTTHF